MAEVEPGDWKMGSGIGSTGMWTCAGGLCPARSAKRATQCRMRAPHIRMVQTMMKMTKIIMTNGHDDDDGHNDDKEGR